MEYKPKEGMVSNAEFIGWLIDTYKEIPIATTGKKYTYLDVPAAFDIETSSFYDHGEKVAIMYEWTFGIGNMVTYGRAWNQLTTLLDCVTGILQTSEYKRLIVYVHNLPYEFQFIRKRFSWTNVFSLDTRKPVYALTTAGIEFRCSLKLSNKSLENTAYDLIKYPVKKMAGDLDYDLIRTPETPLTPEELKYCENDIRVILHYIQEKIEAEGTIAKIPLTLTGYVRRYCKDAMFPEVQGYGDFWDIYPE